MYVYQLAKELINNGHDCMVLSNSDELLEDEYDGIKIIYIPFIKGDFQESSHPSNLHSLISVLDAFNPDIFHLHTLSPSMGATHLLHLKNIGYKTIFTTHLPNFTCTRGDLLKNGIEVCDGIVKYDKCMKCVLNKQGVKSEFIIKNLTRLSRYALTRQFFPALSSVYNKIEQIKIFKNIERIITVSNWQKEILMNNGFVEKQLSVVRQSIASEMILKDKSKKINRKLIFGYIGRIVPEKGFHLLYDTFKNISDADYELKIAAIPSQNHLEYYHTQKQLIEKLSYHWVENVSTNEVISFIDQLDVLLVPSSWLETGPYVIYEALSRKVPVIAFNKGGAVELIKNNVNSILVNNETEFKNEVERVITHPETLTELINNINLNRTTEHLYSEMEKIYTEIN